MKQNRTTIIVFIILILLGGVIRPLGFAPQLAMALFGGAVIRDKKWAFALPVCSLFLSDLAFEALNRLHVLNIPGFYEGQLVNYLLIAGITFLGMAIRRVNVLNVALATVAAPVVYFFLSNFAVWASGNLGYAMNASGLAACYAAALPFFKNTALHTAVFSALLFGGYAVAARNAHKLQPTLV